MGQLNLITSNPVSDAFNAGQKRAADQQAADLTNAINEQSYSQNNQLFPSKLRQVTRAADQADLTYDTDLKEQPDTLMKSKNDAAKSTVDLGKAQEDFDFEQKQHPLTLAGDTADVATKQSQARVQTSTEGAQVSKANNDAIESAARAQVAQNGAKYDMEGRWVDLLSKNPQLAIAQAGQYGVPPELVAMAQDQSKAEWLKTAWANITAQYPNATDAATRAAIFEQEIKTAGNSPTASSAMQIPAGSPKPTTRQDELRGIASQLNLTPGSRDFAAFMTSDGKTLPAQFLSTEEVAAAGFPVGTVVDRSGKVVYKPKGGGSGPFAGTGMDAQTANILLGGDPGSPEYLAAYNMAAQPKSTFDATTGKMVTTTPDMTAYRRPTGAAPGAPPPAPQSAAQPQASPKVVAQAPGLTVTQLSDPATKPPTEDQAKNRQLFQETSQQLPIALTHFDELAKTGNQVGALTPDQVQAYFTSPEYQQASNAILTIVADYLYSVSGATANPGEVKTRSTIVIPRLGESAQSIEDKKARLQGMVDAIGVRANGGTPRADLLGVPASPTAQPQALPADRSQLQTGTMYKTARGPAKYLGNDRWQPVQ